MVNQEVGVAHEVKSPKSQPQFSQATIGQYWLGKTKLKQAFRSTQNAFKSCYGILKIPFHIHKGIRTCEFSIGAYMMTM